METQTDKQKRHAGYLKERVWKKNIQHGENRALDAARTKLVGTKRKLVDIVNTEDNKGIFAGRGVITYNVSPFYTKVKNYFSFF